MTPANSESVSRDTGGHRRIGDNSVGMMAGKSILGGHFCVVIGKWPRVQIIKKCPVVLGFWHFWTALSFSSFSAAAASVN
jgi:hypothetical protein